jgi:hypothetical protein
MSQHSSFNTSSQQDMSRNGPSLSQPNLQPQRTRIQTQRHGSSSTIHPIPIIENIHQYQSGSRTGISGIHRTASKRGSEISSTNDNYYVPAVKLENTYKLGPEETQKFNPTRIQNVVSDVVEEYFENYKYDPIKSKELTKRVSEEIKGKIKPLIYRRYKIIVSLNFWMLSSFSTQKLHNFSKF